MRMSLGRKFQVLLAIALGFVIVVGATALYGVSSLSSHVDEYSKEAVPSLEALSGLATAVGIASGSWPRGALAGEGRERRPRARPEGAQGLQEYKFLNPATKRIEDKVAYLEVVDGLILLSGAYKP